MLPSVGYDARLPSVPVRMAGFEPAVSGTPSRRIARLSHILSGQQFRRLGSNQRPPRFRRGALPPELHRNRRGTRASGGTRTHFVRLTRAVPGPSSIAGLCEQPVLVSSQLDRGSEPPSPPRAWLVGRSRASGGTRTRTRPFTGGVLGPSSCTGVVGPGWAAGYDPAPRRSQGRMQRHYTIPTVSDHPDQHPREESNLTFAHGEVFPPGVEPGCPPASQTGVRPPHSGNIVSLFKYSMPPSTLWRSSVLR
jgi:hypothetical protein